MRKERPLWTTSKNEEKLGRGTYVPTFASFSPHIRVSACLDVNEERILDLLLLMNCSVVIGEGDFNGVIYFFFHLMATPPLCSS